METQMSLPYILKHNNTGLVLGDYWDGLGGD